MVPSIKKFITVLAISLVGAVISQAGVSLASTMPVVTVQKPIDWNDANAVPPRSPSTDRLTMDANGQVYVHDNGLGGGGIAVLKETGQYVNTLPYDSAIGGMAARADGNLVVGFGTYAAIVNPTTGAIVKQLGTPGTPEGSFFKTGGIALDDAGYIYVVDSGYYATWGVMTSHTQGCVKVYNYNGDPITTGVAVPGYPSNSFGASGGAADGSAIEPSGIVYDSAAKQIIVADTMNGRLNFWNVPSYTFAKTIGSQGGGAMQFVLPRGLAIEHSASGTRLYVLDPPQSQVSVIDPAGAGTQLGYIGQYALNPSNGDLQSPNDVYFDATNNLLLVSNGLPNNVTVYGIDGGVSAGGPYLTLDPVPPYSGSNPTTISGTALPGMTITVTVTFNGVAGAPVQVTNISGNRWSYGVPSSAVGTYGISVLGVDPSTQTQIGPKTASFQEVTLGPAPACTMAATNPLMNTTSTTLTGTTSSGASVTIYNQATGVTASATVAGTSWSYAAPLAGDMNNNLTVTCSLNQPLPAVPTNLDATVTRSIVTDVTPPDIEILTPVDHSYTNVGTITVLGRVTDVHTPATVAVSLNGGTAVVVPVQADTSFTLPEVLNVGVNTIDVTATDGAGNPGKAHTTTVTYDNTGPVLTVVSPTDNSSVNTPTVTVSGYIDDVTTTVQVNGTPVPVIANPNPPQNQAGKWSTTVPLNAGTNLITVTATDLAGNPTVTVPRHVTLDTGAPTLAVTSPAADISTKNASITVSGTAGDADGEAVTVTATVDGAPVTVTGTTSWSFAFPMSTEKRYVVVVTVTDVSGNTTSVTRNVIYDVTGPYLTLNPQTTGSLSTITGDVEAGATLTISGTGVTGSTLTRTASGYTFVITGSGIDYSTIQVVATDAAGNTSSRFLNAGKPDGDLNGDIRVDTTDVQICLSASVNLRPTTVYLLTHGDVGPLVAGKPNPDGSITAVDCGLLLQKAMNPSAW